MITMELMEMVVPSVRLIHISSVLEHLQCVLQSVEMVRELEQNSAMTATLPKLLLVV
jgi:hypothetical protein